MSDKSDDGAETGLDLSGEGRAVDLVRRGRHADGTSLEQSKTGQLRRHAAASYQAFDMEKHSVAFSATF